MNRSFIETHAQYDWDAVTEKIESKSDADVRGALSRAGRGTLEDFMALISPAAAPYLEQMAQLSNKLTQKRFGKTIQMYIPLYLSNECSNACSYCGFSSNNKLDRLTLNHDQIMQEVSVIKSLGFDHVLLVTGESKKKVGVDYFKDVIRLIRPYFSHISIEVQPMDQGEYEQLIALGVSAVMVYQETYHKENYSLYHLKGKKTDFEYRLDTPDRLGRAHVRKIGIGALLGLEKDWRTDSFFTALHLDYLEKTYWRTRYSLSFPRLRPAEGLQSPASQLDDRQFLQLLCAYRIFNEDVELSMSTREKPFFRDNTFKLGVTTVSAGSKTDPGGYALDEEAVEQFSISDERTPAEIESVIKSQGYDVVWKDWDIALEG
ncbi:MAG: 2-iminoacetate synthase ThiH [Fibrobacterales bacterium]